MSAYCVFSFSGGVQSYAIYLLLLYETKKLYHAMGKLLELCSFADIGVETQLTYQMY
jgi:hypothetical protein